MTGKELTEPFIEKTHLFSMVYTKIFQRNKCNLACTTLSPVTKVSHTTLH